MKKDLNKTNEQLSFELNDLRKKSKEREKILKAANQQLLATEQQLRAANQQLKANNQQLAASEQQLRAANQQLQAQTEELSRMATVVKDSNDAITIQDLEGNITAWNAGAEKIYGYTDKEAFKMNITELVPDEYKSEVLNFINQFKKDELVESFETKRKTKDGKILDVWMVVTKLVDDKGKLIGAVSTERDITERNAFVKELVKNTQQLEANNQQLIAANQQLDANNQQLSATEQQLRASNQQLATSEKKFRSYIENAPDGVFIANEKGEYLEVNKAACEITGYTKNELLKLTISELISQEYLKKAKNHFQAVIKDGFASSELAYVTKSGEKKFWNVDAVKLSDTRFLGFAKDITKRIQTEEKVRAANQQLEANNQQLTATEQQLRAANQQLIAGEHELKKEKIFSEKIVETASAIIVGIDKDHIIRIFNKGAESITGYTKAEVVGKDWFKMFFPKEMLNEMNKVWKDSWEITSHSYVNPILSKAGKEIIVSWQTTGMYESEDVSKHLLLSIGQDITERKRAEEEIKKRMNELEIFNEATVGRELKIIELKKEINELLVKTGQKPKYEIIV